MIGKQLYIINTSAYRSYMCTSNSKPLSLRVLAPLQFRYGMINYIPKIKIAMQTLKAEHRSLKGCRRWNTCFLQAT